MTRWKHWLRWSGLPMLAYAVALVASLWFLSAHPDSAWRIPVAVLPTLPIVFVVWGGIRRNRELDELQRRITLEGYAFAGRAMILLSIAYGFLANAGFKPINSVYIGVGLVALTAIGRGVARRNYR